MPKAGFFKNGNRYYGNFKKWGGGEAERLVPAGEKYATANREIAADLYTKRVQEYERRQRGLHLLGAGAVTDLVKYAERHLKLMKQEKVEDDHIMRAEWALDLVFRTDAFEGVEVVGQVTPMRVADVVLELSDRNSKHGRRYAPATVRRHVMALSRLCRRAVEEGLLSQNPCDGKAPADEDDANDAVFLEMTEARRLLEALPSENHWKSPWFRERMMVLVYTGMRFSEMNGMMVDDIDFKRNKIIVRRHPHRRLKTKKSAREIPLWPPLREMLQESLRQHSRRGLLWPRPGVVESGGKERRKAMCGDVEKALATVVTAARISKHVTPKVLRHTYVSSRLQMVERDQLGNLAPVDRFLLQREIGHGDEKMINNVYGHVQAGRYRLEVLDFSLVPRWEPDEEQQDDVPEMREDAAAD